MHVVIGRRLPMVRDRALTLRRIAPSLRGFSSGSSTADSDSGADNRSAVEIVTRQGAGLNALLGFSKLTTGVLCGSPALISDAAHSFSDILTDVVALLTFKKSREDPDSDHPYGHGKFESLGTIFVGGVLMATGIGVGFYSFESLAMLMSGDLIGVESAAESAAHLSEMLDPRVGLAMAGFSVVAKEGMYRVTHDVGLKTNSSVLLANAFHHRADAISSVFAFFSIGATLVFDNPYFDPLGGLLVSSLIFKSGAEIILNPISELLDTVRETDDPLCKKVVTLVAEKFQHDVDANTIGIKIRDSGPFVLIDVEVDLLSKSLSSSSAHQIGELIQEAIIDLDVDVGSINVHCNPVFRAEFCDFRSRGEMLLPSPAVFELEISRMLLEFGVKFEGALINYRDNGKIDLVVTIERGAWDRGDECRQLIMEHEDVNQCDVVVLSSSKTKCD